MQQYLSYLRFLRNRSGLLVFLVAFVILSGLPSLQVQVSNDMEDWFPANSQHLLDKKQFIEDFGSDELMFLLLTFPDTASEAYRYPILTSLSDTLAQLHGFDMIFARHQLDMLPTGMGMRSRVKRLEQLYFEGLDSQVEMLYLKTRLIPNFDRYRPALLDSVHQIIGTLPSAIRTDLSGSGVVFSAIEKISNAESGLLLSICFLLVLILLGIRLRSLRRWGSSVLVFLIIFWPAYSLFGWLEIPVNLITMVVPILLLINFFAYILHLFNTRSADQEAFIQKKLPPIIFSAITTMIGFGSLMLSDMLVIDQFGMLTFWGIGVGMAALLLVGIPVMLALLKSENSDSTSQHTIEQKGYSHFLTMLTKPRAILLALVMPATMIGGIILFPQITVDTNSIHFLPPDHPVRQSTHYIEDHFGAFNTVDFLISKTDQSPLSGEDFTEIKEIAKDLEKLSFVRGVVGYSMWRTISTMVRMMYNEVSELLRARYITEDKRRTRMSLRIPMGSVQEMKGHLDEIEALIHRATDGSTLSIQPVGYLPIYIEHMDAIVSGMLRSLGFAILCIMITMMLMVGSWRLGLLALIPNTFPLCGLAIIMAIFDIPLDLGTSVIACVIVGLVVDDTLHIIWNYKKEKARNPEQAVDLSEVMRDILKPSTTTSMIFTLGFMVLILSQARSIHDFGLLVSIAIGLGWLGDFVLFPAVLDRISR